jgi:hypothetical protein
MSQKLLQRWKQNIKNMRNLFKLFTLFIIAVLLVSCEAEKIATHSGTSLLDSKKISLQQFLQETKINNFDTLIHLENKLQNRTADGRYELTDFEIDTNLINRMEYNQKTTYSFVASPKDTIAENYFNLIYYKKNNVWEMKIIELKPNPDNLIQLQNGLTPEFEGQMRIVYESVPFNVAQPCTYVTITVERCQGCIGTCDQCSICVSSTTYSFCNSTILFVSAPPLPPSGFSGGDGGGGGANADPNEIVIDPNLANLDFNKIILFLDNLRTTDLVAYNYFNSHTEIKNQVFRYLGQNDFSEESTIFAKELIDSSRLLEINSMEVWNNSDEYRNRMSEAEKVIFDNMLPNRRMWYLATGYKAKEKATELYPNSLHNGKGDAFRHCYWNALSSKFIGVNLTNQLTTAHEDKPFTYPYEQKEKDMDLYNNNIGQNIATYVSILDNIEQEVLTLLNYGFLRYLSNLNSNSLPTYQSFLTPTNQ